MGWIYGSEKEGDITGGYLVSRWGYSLRWGTLERTSFVGKIGC